MIWLVPVAVAAAVGAVVLATSGKPKKRTSAGSNGKHPRSMRGRFIPREDRVARKATKPKLRSKGLKPGSRAERSYGRRVKQVMRGFKPTVMVRSQFGGPDYPAKIVKDIGEGHVQVITSSGSRWEEPKANLRKWKQGDPVEER